MKKSDIRANGYSAYFLRNESRGSSGSLVNIDQTKGVVSKRRGNNSQLRFKTEILKLIKAKKLDSQRISVPRLVSYDNLRFERYEIEFIRGQCFANYCLNKPITEVETILDNIINHVANLSETSKSVCIENKIKQKISTVEKHTRYNLLGKTSINKIKKLINNTVFRPETICEGVHGDLSFENIIIDKTGSAFFIDYSYCYLETKSSDLAKLYQDLYFYWAYRSVSTQELEQIKSRLYIVRLILNEKINKRFGSEFVENLPLLILVNALRIVPYAQDNDIEFLIKHINLYLNNNVNSSHTCGW